MKMTLVGVVGEKGNNSELYLAIEVPALIVDNAGDFRDGNIFGTFANMHMDYVGVLFSILWVFMEYTCICESEGRYSTFPAAGS